ncbi:hypothetical protein [Kribbella sp. NPDC000426]|uniref:hypothetical protein n=1 Tax=Kribbella sp. NPDC000426 TaxID=3154255 RepID=UPI00331D8EA0
MSQEFMLAGETPSPELVAAWLALDELRAEQVPMWAADWLVAGYDGVALAELAGLSGRDTREVRDLLPAALVEAGVRPLSSKGAALKVAFDHIAYLHVSGRARWAWVVNQVVEVVSGAGYVEEAFGQPLAQLYGVDDEMSEPWSRSDEELAGVVRQACLDQIAGAGPSA